MESQAQQQQPQSGAGEAPGYNWSWARIFEWVTIGVLTWACIGLAGLIGPGALLLLQHVFGYIVVPTHLLETVAYIGLTVVFGLVILVALLYVGLRFVLPRLFRGASVDATLALGAILLGLVALQHRRETASGQGAIAADHAAPAQPKADAPAVAQNGASGMP